MKLFYVSNGRIPTEKAYGLQTASMCQAFAQSGLDVTLIIPRRRNNLSQDLFRYYNVEKVFAVKYIPIIDAIDFGRRFGFWVTRVSYAVVLLFSRVLRPQPDVVIFTRDLLSAVLLKWRGHKVFYDMHGFPFTWLWFWKKACRKMDGIVGTNQWKLDQCRAVFGLPAARLVLARNGYDNKLFSEFLAKDEARRQLDLPQDKPLVVYAGHLYDWKGTDVLAEAAAKLPEFLFAFIGGDEGEVRAFNRRHPGQKNMMVFGQKPHQEMPLYLGAADVLVLPNSARSATARFALYSQYDTSPLKLFEYMSAQCPIVASSLPSIKEVLNEKNAVLVKPDDAGALAEGIRGVLADPGTAESLQKQAWQDVQQYRWSERARIIINFINSLIYA